MSLMHYMLLPYLLDSSFYDVTRPTIYDQNFGVGLSDFVRDFSVPLKAGYMRPWRFSPSEASGLSSVINDKDSFKVNLDVQQFKPEELAVKVVDKQLVVEGKHEERSDEHGVISRQFIRKYSLPDNVDKDSISSTLSSDGVLQLTALKKYSGDTPEVPIKKNSILKPTPESENIRTIFIIQTNQPVKQVKAKEDKTETNTEQKKTEGKQQKETEDKQESEHKQETEDRQETEHNQQKETEDKQESEDNKENNPSK